MAVARTTPHPVRPAQSPVGNVSTTRTPSSSSTRATTGSKSEGPTSPPGHLFDSLDEAAADRLDKGFHASDVDRMWTPGPAEVITLEATN